ncbi:MAG: ribosome assembly RNA-binding protein YhbY [Clostridia bacterium]|nr:ribosome assembly RNA-binding protein YhbY [Clostridia bacterium]
MNSKQRAYLRKLAQKIEPIFQIGKIGISDNQIEQLNNALEARELIKITFLDTIPDDKETIANEIASKTNSQIVQIVGKKLTLYRKSVNKPTIELP